MPRHLAVSHDGGMPRERAWSAAVRFESEGRSPPEIQHALVQLGFPTDEAQIAVGALAATKVHTDRWVAETRAKEDVDRGYFAFLWASLLLAAGLVGINFPGFIGWSGGASLFFGACWFARGTLMWWRGRGV
jgi:hypothetical protein